MILTAHQPVYLPWCGLFHKIAMADTFVLFDDVRYTPRSFENRNRLWTSRGPQWLTVPVHHKRDTIIKDVRINNSLPWARKHWKSIWQSYHKAPHFYGSLEATLEWMYEDQPWDKLATLNERLLSLLLDELQISVEILKASDYQFTGTKSALVLEMCQR